MSDGKPRVPVLKYYYMDPAEDRPVERTGIEFAADDGWVLRATIDSAKKRSQTKSPAIILLAEPGLRVRTIFGIFAEPLALSGFVVLILDMRGSAGSHGTKDFEKFSPAEIDGLQLDIQAAVQQLAQRPDVDVNRIAILAGGVNTNYAILHAADNPGVRALVLMTADPLNETAVKIIETCPNLPILTAFGEDQPKHLQKIWAEPYFLSSHPASRLVLGADQGPTMLFRKGGMIERIVEWLSDNVGTLPVERAVSFTTSDGWRLSGTLYLPPGANTAAKAPAAVFVHGLNHSEQSWATIPVEVARHGVAALAFDLRGTRKSINKDKGEIGVDMTYEDLDGIFRDVKAAVEFIAAQEEVDLARIGLVSATAICNHTVRAAIGDPRIKSLAMLSFFGPAPDVREYLGSNDVPIFVVASSEDVNPDGSSLADSSRVAYDSSMCKRSQFLLYDDAGRGNGMPFAKPEIVGMLGRWLQETLGA